GVGGGYLAQDVHDDEQEGVAGAAGARADRPIPELGVVQEVGHAAADGAEDYPEHGGQDGEGDQGGPVQPPRQRQRTAQRGSGGENPAGRRRRQPQQDGAAGRETEHDQSGRDQGGDPEVGAEDHPQRRGQRRLPADDGRAQQFAPPRLLLRPRIADDQDQAY